MANVLQAYGQRAAADAVVRRSPLYLYRSIESYKMSFFLHKYFVWDLLTYVAVTGIPPKGAQATDGGRTDDGNPLDRYNTTPYRIGNLEESLNFKILQDSPFYMARSGRQRWNQ